MKVTLRYDDVIARSITSGNTCFIVGIVPHESAAIESPFAIFTASQYSIDQVRALAQAYTYVADHLDPRNEQPTITLFDYEVGEHSAAVIHLDSRRLNRLPDTFWAGSSNPETEPGIARELAAILTQMADQITHWPTVSERTEKFIA